MDMRYAHVFAVSAVVSAVLIFAANRAHAQTQQQRPVGGVPRNHIPSTNHFSWEGGHDGFRDRFHGGFGNVWVVEREVPVVVEKEVVKEVPVAVEAPAAAPPRKPYVIGASYSSLPGSCMKLIEEGVSFYYCGGDWYRQEGKQYRAVARKL